MHSRWAVSLLCLAGISCATAEDAGLTGATDAKVDSAIDSTVADTNSADTNRADDAVDSATVDSSKGDAADGGTDIDVLSDDAIDGSESSTSDASDTSDTSDTSIADTAVDADTGPTAATWTTDAVSHACTLGVRYAYVCPSGGIPSSVWGSDPYTDDSSICTAGVHAGVITSSAGGTVVIQMSAGAAAYAPSTANGITTLSYGSWSCSFDVIRPTGDGGTDVVVDTAPPPTPATSSTTAADHVCSIGSRYAYACPPGTAASIWGSSPYTYDSAICTAAVHAGKITLSAGGDVTLEMRAGESAYVGTTAHGITSSSWGAFSCSYVFI